MSYASYDFTESLDRAGIERKSVKRVIAAWGDSPEGYGSWEGGFLMEMADGRYAYLTGWCDASGWGCQDGARVFDFDEIPANRALLPDVWGDGQLGPREWDEEPADLNAGVKGD